MRNKKTIIFLIIFMLAIISIACAMPNFIKNPLKNILGDQLPDVGDVEELVEQLPDELPDLPNLDEVEDIISEENLPDTEVIAEQVEAVLDDLVTSIADNDTSMLDNYRTTFSMAYEGTGESGSMISQTIDMNEEINRSQGMYHNKVSIIGSGTDAEDGEVHLYVQGENTYLYNPATPEYPCIMISGSMANLNDVGFLRPEDFFDVIDTLELVERGVMVNGIKSDHYKVKNSGMTMEETYEESADIWVSQADGFIARYIGFSDGKFNDGDQIGEGRVEWEYNLFDVGQVAVIDFPVECRDQQESVDEVPIPENATNTEKMAGIITFNSPDSPEKLGDYYREQLPAQGWKITEDSVIAKLVMMTAEKENQSLQIMITVGDSAGSSAIISTIPLQ